MNEDGTNESTALSRRNPMRLGLLTLAFLVGSLMLGCAALLSKHPQAPSTSAPVSASGPRVGMLDEPASDKTVAGLRNLPLTPQEASHYVGDRACGVCHRDIARRHGMTNHTAALHSVTVDRYGDWFRTGQALLDQGNETRYRPIVKASRCAILGSGPVGDRAIRAELALGSGRHGVTFLGRDDSDQWFALRLSYYTPIRGWDFSPDQSREGKRFGENNGQPVNLPGVQSCLSCHVSSLVMQANGPNIAASHLGVGCERCHGPGVPHVEAMRREMHGAHAKSTAYEDLKQAPASRIQAVCGDCHSSETPGPFTDAESQITLARFKSTAFAQSLCVQRSSSFSCISCHDPHTNAVQSRAAYEKVCLKCHAAPRAASKHPGAVVPAVPDSASVCKVNARTGCIGCHMPAQNIRAFPHIQLHNHWIRVWHPSDSIPKSTH